jgi:hypothetical protein
MVRNITALVAALLAAAPVVASGPSLQPVFVEGPTLTVPRMGHQTVSLGDGRRLLIGGHTTGFVSLSSADVLAPTADGFSLAAMNFFHDSGAVARLQDGRLLLAGGAADWGIAPGYPTAEIYNPADGSFTPTGTMAYGRMQTSATTLTSGQVLVVGGWYDAGSSGTAEVYDPASGVFTPTGALQVARGNPIAVATADGGALLFSGWPTYGGAIFESVEEYSAATNSFGLLRERLCDDPAAAGWVPYPYLSYGGVTEDQRLPDGRYLYLASRIDGATTRFALFTIDPVTKIIALYPTAPLPDATTCYPMTVVVDAAHRVAYLPATVPGSDPTVMVLMAVSLADGSLAMGSSAYTFPSALYLSGTTVVPLNDGRLLLSGATSEAGYGTNFAPVQRTWLITPNYTPATTAVAEATTGRPGRVSLAPNHPNPFNPSTTIEFAVPAPGQVRVRVFTALGVEVASLVDGPLAAGRHQVTWRADGLPSGVYLCRLEVGATSVVRRLVLAK